MTIPKRKPRGAATRRGELTERILSMEAGMHQAVGYSEPVAWLGAELTMAQVKVLFALMVMAPVSLGGLAQAMQSSVATASQVVDRLVQQRLVSRVEDESDRRFVRLSLTEDGRALVARLHRDSGVRTKRLLDVMTEEELELVARGMGVMMEAAKRLAPARPAKE